MQKKYNIKAKKIEERIKWELFIGEIKLGWKGIRLSSIMLNRKDISIEIKDMNILFLFFKTGRKKPLYSINISKVSVKKLNPTGINANKKSSQSIYIEALFVLVKEFYNIIFHKQYPRIGVKEMTVLYNTKLISFTYLHLDGASFSFDTKPYFFGIELNSHIVGYINSKDGKIIIEGLPNKQKSETPAFCEKANLICRIEYNDIKSEFNIVFDCNIKKARLFNQIVGERNIFFDSISFKLVTELSKNHFTASEDSSGNVDDVLFAIQISYNKDEHDLIRIIFHFEIEVAELKRVLHLFSSKDFSGIDGDGKILVRIKALYNILNPVEYFFDIATLQNSIEIKEWGTLDMAFLNFPFIHEVYKDKELIRSIDIKGDEDTGSYRERKRRLILNEIIVFCEDPNFYNHHGIDPVFIGNAIAVNMQEKKFVRGASTITMQLVKNLFLSNSKTIGRKIEEIVIALIIENYFKISKDRLLEIYLQIIEFGPNIYGIEEAANFYFKKEPGQLNIVEYIILTYIIPRPIHFYEALQWQSPQLINNLSNHVKLISQKLLRKQMITLDDIAFIDNILDFTALLKCPKVDYKLSPGNSNTRNNLSAGLE